MIGMQPQMARPQAPSDRVACDAARVAVVGVLELVGLAAAAIGPTGRLIATNPRFERLMPNAASKCQKHLRLVGGTADVSLCEVLARLAHEQDWEDVRAIPVPAVEARPPIILHVIPVRGPASDLLPGVLAIVIAAQVAPRDIPSDAVLQGLFNMTPAEARVTRAVAQRCTIAETARRLELSQETVRSQLKAALAKTGLSRKLDLAVMLTSACLPLAPEQE
jgi:DNA-binding CsgD family transcriptional regulator